MTIAAANLSDGIAGLRRHLSGSEFELVEIPYRLQQTRDVVQTSECVWGCVWGWGCRTYQDRGAGHLRMGVQDRKGCRQTDIGIDREGGKRDKCKVGEKENVYEMDRETGRDNEGHKTNRITTRSNRQDKNRSMMKTESA